MTALTKQYFLPRIDGDEPDRDLFTLNPVDQILVAEYLDEFLREQANANGTLEISARVFVEDLKMNASSDSTFADSLIDSAKCQASSSEPNPPPGPSGRSRPRKDKLDIIDGIIDDSEGWTSSSEASKGRDVYATFTIGDQSDHEAEDGWPGIPKNIEETDGHLSSDFC